MDPLIEDTRKSLFPEKISSRLLFRVLFRLFVFLSALFIVLTGNEVYGAIAFVLFICLLLILSSRVTDPLFPFLLMGVFLFRIPNLYSVLYDFIWVLIPLFASLLFHFIYYFRKPKTGPTFIGLCAVSVALLLGGLGSISWSDYTNPKTVYCTLGLGVGMIIAYLLIFPAIGRIESLRLIRYLYLTGLFAVCIVLLNYILNWNTFIEEKTILSFNSSDTLATFLMMSLPFPFFYATRHRFHCLLIPILYLGLFFSGSHGGLVMGTFELLLLLLLFAIYSPKKVFNRVFCIVSFILTCGLLYYFMPLIFKLYGHASFDVTYFLSESIPEKFRYIISSLIQDGEIRRTLIGRAITYFKENPFFGVGLGGSILSDLFPNDFLFSYHMNAVQVLGTMGTLGILAYGYQLIQRIVITIKNRCFFTITCACSYLGLFLISEVTPGEFYPLPYCFLAMILFILVEKKPIENPPIFGEEEKIYNRKVKRYAIRRIRSSVKK